MKPHRYHINVFYSAEDGCFVADVPDLAHCSAFGETPEDALREVGVAVNAWVAAARKLRRPVPKPRYRPAIYQGAAQ
jgi:predicted RNase H-like HicB family nuclease